MSASRVLPTSRAARAVDRLLGWLLLLTLAAAAPAQTAQPQQSDEEKVEALLAQYGLTELQTLHLERELTRARTDGKRPAIAKRLADLYVAQLLSTRDPKKAEELIDKVRKLIKSDRAVDGPSLQILLLQGSYQQAENLARKWTSDPDREGKARDEARKLLEDIVPKLDQAQQALLRRVKQEEELLDRIRDDQQRDRKEAEINMLRNLAGRANYFVGWGNYYLAQVGADFLSKTRHGNARQAFRRLFEQARPSTDEEIKELELHSEPRARAALGIAVTSLALGETELAEAWFNAVRHQDTDPTVRDELGYWQVQGLLNIKDFDGAKKAAQREIETFTDAYTAGRLSLCVLLVRAGFGRANDKKPELGLLGIKGLARMRRYDLARKLIADHGISTQGQQNFVLAWLDAQNALDRAEKSRAGADYKTALAAFQKALASPDAKNERQLAEQCRYSVAWCYYRLNDHVKAAAEFRACVQALKASQSELAADAAWMLAGTLQALSASDPKQKDAAIAAFEAFARDFPGHPRAASVKGIVLRMKRGALKLTDLDPKDPQYGENCLYFLRQCYGRWRAAVSSDPAKAAVEARDLDAILALIEKIPALVKKDEIRMETLLVQAHLALKGAKPDPARARTILTQADAVAGKLPEDSSQLTDHRFFKLQAAQLARDTASIKEHATWLARNRPGTPHQEHALIVLTQLAEEAWKSASETDKLARRAEMLRAYQELVKAVGYGTDTLKANRNAAVACARLVGYLMESGDHREAEKYALALVSAYPRDARYLRNAALIESELGKWQDAQPRWRLLCNGLPKDSEGWFEAKYHHMAALRHLNKEGARKEFEQFKLLYPKMGPGTWPEKFKKLEETLSR